MTLEDWLKQDRNLADQLKVIEGLCSALNEAHESGNVYRALRSFGGDFRLALAALPGPRDRRGRTALGRGRHLLHRGHPLRDALRPEPDGRTADAALGPAARRLARPHRRHHGLPRAWPGLAAEGSVVPAPGRRHDAQRRGEIHRPAGRSGHRRACADGSGQRRGGWTQGRPRLRFQEQRAALRTGRPARGRGGSGRLVVPQPGPRYRHFQLRRPHRLLLPRQPRGSPLRDRSSKHGRARQRRRPRPPLQLRLRPRSPPHGRARPRSLYGPRRHCRWLYGPRRHRRWSPPPLRCPRRQPRPPSRLPRRRPQGRPCSPPSPPSP